MKTVMALIVCLLMLTPFALGARSLSPSTPARYVLALHTANAFLFAWVQRDAESGVKLISRRLANDLKKKNKAEWFRDYMVGLSNPHHQSFEISHGKLKDPKRLSFPVVLYEHYTGEPEAFEYIGSIELVQENKSWKVDKLPRSSDNEE